MIRILPVSLALAPLLLAACGEDCVGFDGPDDALLDLGEVGVGQTGTASITLAARCDSSRAVTAATSGEGFSVSPGSLTLDGGSSATLDVLYTAPAEGPATGSLVLASDDGFELGLELSASGIPWLDADEDGYSSVEVGGDDCDDADPDVNPGADEIWYDGVDQDCAGDSDFDQDGDGVDVPEDCDDTDPDVRPGTDDTEDGSDSDCDGLIDEGPLGIDDVLITEIMHSPAAVSDGVGEWIEIHNRGSVSVNLMGLRMAFADGEGGFTIDRGTVVPAGGYAVLGADGRASNNGGAPVDFVYDRNLLRLVAPEGGVSLIGAGDRVISRVVWTAGWPDLRGAALQVDPAAAAEEDLAVRGLWCLATETMVAGDAGTPGGPNTACPRFDADGDGVAAQDGDCDDSDPDVNPSATEVWGDGIDNDCDGFRDEGALSDLRSARLVGGSAPNAEGLSFQDALSVGDLDDDGELDVLIGARFGAGYAGAVYLLDADAAGRSGSVEDRAFAVLEGATASNQLGALAPVAGDVTGDGIADLVVGGTDARSEDDVAAVVIAGGSGLSGSLGVDDAVLTLTGARATTAGDVHGALDLDADGSAELIYGDVGRIGFSGRVVVVAGGSTGTLDASDALRRWDGAAGRDQLGASLGGADLDDDGYDDLLATAWLDDTGAINGGAVHLISGGSSLPASGAATSASSTRFVGDRDGTRLGEGAAARVADLDGDGALDVLIGAPLIDRAYVWLDAGSLSGGVSTSEADHVLEGPGLPDSFGGGLTVADVDGDGLPEAVIGAPDDLTAVTGLATEPGEIFVFDLDGGPRVLGPAEARATVRGASIGDAVGQSLLGADLNGDGVDDLIIGAPGEAGGAGAVHLMRFTP